MHILVSGAGIAGNTLTCFLGRAGISVTLIERDASCLTQGQSIDIEGPARQIMDKLNLLPELKKRHTGETGSVFETASNRPIATFQAPKSASDKASPTSEFEILRGDLSAMLYDASRTHPSVHHVLGQTITAIESQTSSSITVRLSDSTALTADALVLCDGAHSRLRRSAFPAESIIFVDKDAFLFLGTLPRITSDTSMWRIFHAPRRRILSLRPDPHGTVRACIGAMPRSAAEREKLVAAVRAGPDVQRALMRDLFRGAGWETERIVSGLGEARDFYYQTTVQVRMKRWAEGRVVALGDAAYCPTPFSGMGCTVAIMGGYILAGEIVRHGAEGLGTAFEQYERSLRPFVDSVQAIPSIIPGIIFPDSWLGVWAFRMAVWAASWVLKIPRVTDLFPGGEEQTGFELPEYEFEDGRMQEKVL